MKDWIWVIVCPIIAYLIGSIPFSYIVTKLTSGKDLRETGNKNVGGINTMLVVGMGFGMFAGFLDFAKGLVCVLTVMLIPFDDTPLYSADPKWQLSWHSIIYILVAAAVILGHNYPVFLKFQGGRGIAASVGIIIITNPLILVIFVICNLILIVSTRYVRPSQFLALFVAVPASFFIPIHPPWLPDELAINITLGLLITALALAIFPKYLRAFIDMFRGKEYKIGKEKIILPPESEGIEQTKN